MSSKMFDWMVCFRFFFGCGGVFCRVSVVFFGVIVFLQQGHFILIL
jgi:hypothetical protein